MFYSESIIHITRILIHIISFFSFVIILQITAEGDTSNFDDYSDEQVREPESIPTKDLTFFDDF